MANVRRFVWPVLIVVVALASVAVTELVPLNLFRSANGGTPQPSITPSPVVATASPSPSPTPKPADPTPTPTRAPTPAPSPFHAEDWLVTINSVALGQANPAFPAPDPGNVYWILEVTLQNTAAVPQAAGWGWRLQDNQMSIRDAEIFPIKSPRLQGDVPPQGIVHGYLAFQVVTGNTPVAALFQPGTLGSGDPITIKLPPPTARSG